MAKIVKAMQDIPINEQAHYCVLELERVTIPGDERSRSNPGHGYPETTETYTKLTRFDSQAELDDWVGKQRDTTGFMVLTVQRHKVSPGKTQVKW